MRADGSPHEVRTAVTRRWSATFPALLPGFDAPVAAGIPGPHDHERKYIVTRYFLAGEASTMFPLWIHAVDRVSAHSTGVFTEVPCFVSGHGSSRWQNANATWSPGPCVLQFTSQNGKSLFVWVLCPDSSRLHPALQLFLRPGILFSSFPLSSFPWIRRQDSPPRAGNVLEPLFILRAEPASHFHTRRRASAGLRPRGRTRDLPRSPAPRAFSAQQEQRTRAIDDPACRRTKYALGHMRQPHSSHCAVTS